MKKFLFSSIILMVLSSRVAFGAFIVNGDGTVTDTSTGLMWQRGTAGSMTWEAALTYCEGLSLGGHDDWRLPNINELRSLVDFTRCNPAIDTIAFPDTMSSIYWSSTTHADSTSYAWCMYFFYGDDNGNDKSDTLDVRAVRGGQSGSSDDLIIVAPTDLTTTESGDTATFTIVLAARPSEDVTIAISSSDETEGTASPASLTFTPDDWNSPQTVFVTGVDDDLFDGDVAYAVITHPAISGDQIFNDLDPQDVSVLNQDNEPTLIELDQFSVVSQGWQVTIKWTTLSETDNAGFNLWRSESKSEKYAKINSRIIDAEGGPTLKADYSYDDTTVKPGLTYYYRLEDIDTRGVSTFHGPVSAAVPITKPIAKPDYSYPPYRVEWYPPWPPVYDLNYLPWWPYYPYP